jgi:hypothetical protein
LDNPKHLPETVHIYIQLIVFWVYPNLGQLTGPVAFYRKTRSLLKVQYYHTTVADWLRVEPRVLGRHAGRFETVLRGRAYAEDTNARGGYRRGFHAHRKIILCRFEYVPKL